MDKKEVYFLVAVKNKPWFAVEVELSDVNPSPNLNYYKSRLKIPFVFQAVKTPDVDFVRDEVRIISANKFLSGLV